MPSRQISEEQINRFLQEAEDGLSEPRGKRANGAGQGASRSTGHRDDGPPATRRRNEGNKAGRLPLPVWVPVALGVMFVTLVLLTLVSLSRGERLASLEREISRLEAQTRQTGGDASAVEFELQQLSARVDGLATRLSVITSDAAGLRKRGAESADSPRPVEAVGVDTKRRTGQSGE